MQGFGNTRYPDLVVVGAWSSSWDTFTDENSGRTVEAGEAYYLDVSQGETLGELGRVRVDRTTYDSIVGAGWGTVIAASGRLENKKGRKIIRADQPGSGVELLASA